MIGTGVLIALFWHGDEEHSDTEAAFTASGLGYRTIAWPCDKPETRGDFESDETMPPLPPLVRNKTIAVSCTVLIAAPHQPHEIRRSGTWSTVRYARTAGKTVYIVGQYGDVRKEGDYR